MIWYCARCEWVVQLTPFLERNPVHPVHNEGGRVHYTNKRLRRAAICRTKKCSLNAVPLEAVSGWTRLHRQVA
eukprot:16046024-Heterocapsa_arctica.AAC.1